MIKPEYRVDPQEWDYMIGIITTTKASWGEKIKIMTEFRRLQREKISLQK